MRRPAALVVAAVAAAFPLLAFPAPRTTPVEVTGSFQRVVARGDFDVQVREGSPASVEIVAEPGVADHIAVEVSGGELRISRKDRWTEPGTKGAVVRVVIPELRGMSMSGSGDGTAETGPAPRDLDLGVSGSGSLRWKGTATALRAGVSGSGTLDVSGDARDVVVAVSGSGDVKLAGKAETMKVSVSGSGGVNAKGFAVKDAKVSVAGSGDVSIRLAGGTLDANIAGSGDVEWSGEGKVGAGATPGSGRVVHR